MARHRRTCPIRHDLRAARRRHSSRRGMTPRDPLIVDAQLRPALARWLTVRGHKAEHVADRHMEAASDAGIWDFALQAPMAIIMEDEAFAQRKVPAEGGPVVIWIRLPNTRRQALLAWFEEVLPDVLAAMERGDTLIEVI